MHNFVDQFSDSSFKVLYSAFSENPGTEAFIKSASIDDVENATRPSTSFAWPEERLFPIDSPSQAALSKLYMHKQAGIPEDVTARCDKALELYGVEMPLNEKVAAVASKPQMDTPEMFKLAEGLLVQQQRRMSMEDKMQVSVQLVKQASNVGIRPNGMALSYTGLTMSDRGVMRDWIEARAIAAANPVCKEAYEKLAEAVGSNPGLEGNRDELSKVAGALQELDEMAGLTKHYGRKLPDPMTTVFNTDKLADEMLNVAGSQVPLETMLQISPEIYADVFGEDVADEFIEDGRVDPELLKVILPTVPLDLQKVLVAQLGLR